MKNTLLLGLAFLLLSCNGNDGLDTASGYFEAEERIISSEQMGRLLRIYQQDGQSIKKGELIAVIDSTQWILQREQLDARITAVKSKIRSANDDVAVLIEKRDFLSNESERVKRLIETGAATTKQKDELETEIQVINRQIESIRSNMSEANRAILAELKPLNAQKNIINDQIQRCYVRSPMDGYLVEYYTEDGELASPGKPIAKVARRDEMIFKIYLSNRQLERLAIGDNLAIQLSGNQENKSLEGKLVWISGQAEFTPKNVQTPDEQSNLVYAAKLTVKNNGYLRNGMPGRVQLNKEQDDTGE